MSRYKNLYKTTLILPTAYFTVVSGFLIWHGSFFHPDQIFAAGLLLALILGRSKQFIQDWSVPVVLLLSYDYLRGLVPKLTQSAHIYPMINFDKIVFGSLPTNTLQSILYKNGTIHWYDWLGTILYMSHFIVPMVFGFIFWLKDREIFKKYFLSLLILSYLAFFTYMIFPAMPPWMAAQKGIIPQVNKVMDQVFASFAQPINLPSVYQTIGVNLVAAVPSLHAAYPFLTLLFLVKVYKNKGFLILPYVLGVWFAIVYFGEHYVFDIVVGVVYALAVYLLVIKSKSIGYQLRKLLRLSIITEKLVMNFSIDKLDSNSRYIRKIQNKRR